MRLAKKPVVKRIRPLRKQKIKPIEVNIESKAESSKPFLELNDYSMQFLKMSINFMFVLNGTAAASLLALNLSQYILSIYCFSSGTVLTVMYTILLHSLVSPIKNEAPKINSKVFIIIVKILEFSFGYFKILGLYVPLLMFTIGSYPIIESNFP